MIYEQQKTGNSLKIFSRIRPFLPHEMGQEQAIKKNPDNSITVKYRDEAIKARFDRVFCENSSQEDVFHSIEKEVKGNLFRGISSTILAYGQTGSGKTYTMYGNHKKGEIDYEETDKMGLIPRILESIVTSSPMESEVHLSFLQIYNEKLDDLLNDDHQKLEIKEDENSGIFIKGLTEYKINQPEEAIWLLARGEKIRAVRQTKMNFNSSRSHLILQVRYQSQEDTNGHVYRGKLLLCDLAGSERMTQDVNHKNQHFQELKYINLSLTNLGKVINILSKRNPSGQNLTRKAPIGLSHNLSNIGIKKPKISNERVKIVPPYRNSKLTRILKQSLESSPSSLTNPKTYIFIALNPSSHQIEESMNSLRFAKNAQNVKISRCKENKISASDLKVIKNLKQEIKFLKDVLGMKTRAGNFSEILWRYKTLEKENKKLRKIVAKRSGLGNDQHYFKSDSNGENIKKLYEENQKLKKVINKIGVEIENEESKLSKKLEFLSEMNMSVESDHNKEADHLLNKSMFSDISKLTKSARLGSQPKAYEDKNSSIFFKKKKKLRPLQLELQYSKVGISTDMRTGVIRDTASPRRPNRGKFDRLRARGSESSKVDHMSRFKNFSELRSLREARMKTEGKKLNRLPVIKKDKSRPVYPATTAVSPTKPKNRLKLDKKRRSFSSNHNGLNLRIGKLGDPEKDKKNRFFYSTKFGKSADSVQSQRKKHSKSALVRHPNSDLITKNRMKLPPARLNSIGFGSQSTGNLKKQRRKIAEYDKRLDYFKRQLQDMRTDVETSGSPNSLGMK